jgi:hypothetical protein
MERHSDNELSKVHWVSACAFEICKSFYRPYAMHTAYAA